MKIDQWTDLFILLLVVAAWIVKGYFSKHSSEEEPEEDKKLRDFMGQLDSDMEDKGQFTPPPQPRLLPPLPVKKNRPLPEVPKRRALDVAPEYHAIVRNRPSHAKVNLGTLRQAILQKEILGKPKAFDT